jgi:RecA/RadA recombinase
MQIKEVTVKELNDLYHSGKYHIEIDTPDGYIPVIHWFNKGLLPIVRIETKSGLVTKCATNHLLQREFDSWIAAGNVEVGTELITENSETDIVTAVYQLEEEECFDFTVDHPNHRYWGDGFSSHNSGKSFFVSGNIAKNAQDQGIFVVMIDTENALDQKWLHKLGVDTSPEKLLKISASMIDDVAKVISEFVEEYKQNNLDTPKEERPKILFIIDSIGMLLTPTEVDQFNKGDMKGDMGRKAKQLKALVSNCVNMFGDLNIGMVVTNHTYASQDMFDPDDKISGGQGFIFAASIVVGMKKLKLKEDEEGNKITEVTGIRSACKVVKSRYSKPFESIKVDIPWETGMNPISGLFDLFEKTGKLVKEGKRYSYTSKTTGEVMLYFRKEWNDFDKMKVIMDEFTQDDIKLTIGQEEAPLSETPAD